MYELGRCLRGTHICYQQMRESRLIETLSIILLNFFTLAYLQHTIYNLMLTIISFLRFQNSKDFIFCQLKS